MNLFSFCCFNGKKQARFRFSSAPVAPSISALAARKPEEGVYMSHKSVCTVRYFSYFGGETLREFTCGTRFVRRKTSLCLPVCLSFFFFVLFCVFLFFFLHLRSLLISLSLSRLVRIILCPLHDCYKLCIQRRRC